MIKRIVKMTFQSDKVAEFLEVFNSSKEKIRAFSGCNHLELWQQKDIPHVMFTYSLWNSEEDLNRYRNSELFASTWAKTKPLFTQKAEAWTVEVKAALT